MTGDDTASVVVSDVATRAGRVHVARAGAERPGTPVVLLHQTPRSWDEFAEVLALLGTDRPVVAVDSPGYGRSAAPVEHTIEAYADGVVAALDALGLGPLDLVGHHTGGVVAIEVAARDPARVRRLVLSSTPFVDAAARAARAAREHVVDDVPRAPDGAHLTAVWAGRAPWYPPQRPELLERFVVDWLRAHDPAAGHTAVGGYVMEDRLDALTMPVLCVGHGRDPHAMPSLEPVVEVLGARSVVIADGHVPLEHTAADFAAHVRAFLDGSVDA